MVKIMENPIKMDDLGVSLFSETSKWDLGTFFFRPTKPGRFPAEQCLFPFDLLGFVSKMMDQ